MDSHHKNFRGQLDEEIVLCYFRRHWIQISGALFLLPILLWTFILVYYFRTLLVAQTLLGSALLSLCLLVLTCATHYPFLSIFRYYLSTVIITNMRVVILDKSVFFRDTATTVDLSKIQDIQKVQVGLLPHLFKFGTIKIFLSGGEPIEILLVPQPDFHFKKMNEVKKSLEQENSPSTTTTVPFLESTPVK